MKNLIFPIFLGLLCSSFAVIPAAENAERIPEPKVDFSPRMEFSEEAAAAVSVYNETGLAEYGLSMAAFSHAWKGYETLLRQQRIRRTGTLTICDFSQSSLKKRMYIIDVESRRLLKNTWVAHGQNSGLEYATRFSNKPESLQSSLGFYVTSGTYMGKHGLSLRMEGMEPGFNDQAMNRAIVLHGAAYVNAARAVSGTYMGRSWGCPAVPDKEAKQIIETIKNGTCLFIYHPDRRYLQGSKILND